MGVGDDAPVDADFFQNRNHPFRKTGLGGEIAAGERSYVRVPKKLHLAALDPQFHLQRFVANERGKSVVIGEVDQVHARFAAAGVPAARGLVGVVPTAAVAKLAGGREALHIFYKSA